MTRRLRWLFLVALVLLVAGAAGALLLVRPDLADARDHVDATWRPLRASLATRYEALAKVDQVLTTAGASERAVTRDLHRALARWQSLSARPDTGADAAGEATTANALEALARRARANVSASDKLKANKDLAAAFSTFDQAALPAVAASTYNAAVRDYESAREGTVHHLVASVLGFDSRPRLIAGA
jgi:hypothetical protein